MADLYRPYFRDEFGEWHPSGKWRSKEAAEAGRQALVDMGWADAGNPAPVVVRKPRQPAICEREGR